MAAGVFVTGTDTAVGKTVASACLVARWNADYWKPAQTGLASEPGDSETVYALTEAHVHAPRFEFAAPLSVEAAAALENTHVALEDFILPVTARPIVVEGAGGVMVPLAPGVLMLDLMARLGLPVVLVARTALGTINHTLLSLAALRGRGIAVAGAVLVGPPSAGNRQAIEQHGGVPILLEIPPLGVLSRVAIAEAAKAMPDFQACVPA